MKYAMNKTTTIIKNLKQGERLFSEGDDSDFIYLLKEGSLHIFTETSRDAVSLSHLSEGEYVGELGVLQNTKRNACVEAAEDSELEQLSLLQFIERVSHNKEKSLKLLHSLSYRTHNVALLSEQVAKQIADHKASFSVNPFKVVLRVFTAAFRVLRKLIYKRELARYEKRPLEQLPNGKHVVRKGRALFLEGQASHFACRVLEGRFKARKSLHDSHQDIADIDAGEFVGEMGLILGVPRSLTLIALGDSTVEIMDENAFLHCVSEDRDVFIHLINSLSQRASVLNQHLRELTEQYAEVINPSVLIQTKQLFQNMGHLSHVTGHMLEQDLYALQTALALEAAAVQGMVEVYYRYINGNASQAEMDQANADFRNFLKTLGLGALIIIPGSFITIPLIVKLGKSVGIDILPKIRS